MNNDIELAWLKQVFERYVKQKARQQWRLLLVDDHGTHLARGLTDFSDANKTLLAVFLHSSTQTLQPLNVVLFPPLSNSYSQELDRHLHQS
jgi:hypothetical protein